MMKTTLFKTLSHSSLILLGLMMFSQLGVAGNKALIMGIGHYANASSNLTGIDLDRSHARFIAKMLGVSEADMTEYSDTQLTLTGMRQAFDKLIRSVQADDAVLVYYSGHGSRRKMGSSCSESLVTYDGQAFSDQELEKKLQHISQKARKLIVFLDSCFSGGATYVKSRTYDLSQSAWQPKYLPGDNCSRPSNITRDYHVLATKWGDTVNNYTYIAAARDDEASFAGINGSVATLAWRACLENGAEDSDASGGITAEEIQQCAQDKINRTIGNSDTDRPHHVTLAGNTHTVLELTKNLIAEAAPVTAPDAKATLQDIFNSRDARRQVKLTSPGQTLRINQDWLAFTVQSAHNGYVYVLMVGSDNKTFAVLFPNAEDPDNRISAGSALALPRSHWRIRAAGPEGSDRLLVLVTETPRDFASLATSTELFPSISSTADNTRALQALAGTIKGDCHGSDCRYGAALLDIEEKH
ncbi:caspase family protein [Methylocucumis oryzae]|nr:caspase family protein [Methylocucumis oryzae]